MVFGKPYTEIIQFNEYNVWSDGLVSDCTVYSKNEPTSTVEVNGEITTINTNA